VNDMSELQHNIPASGPRVGARIRIGSRAWQLDAAASHGELATRHWFRGRQSVPIELMSGQLVEDELGGAELMLQFRMAARRGAAVQAMLRARTLVRAGTAWLAGEGDLRVDVQSAQLRVRVHDLGGAATGNSGRRFLTVAGEVDGALPGLRRLWRGPGSGDRVDFHMHTEWVADDGPVPAA
jgi:hypothetical protein